MLALSTEKLQPDFGAIRAGILVVEPQMRSCYKIVPVTWPKHFPGKARVNQGVGYPVTRKTIVEGAGINGMTLLEEVIFWDQEILKSR